MNDRSINEENEITLDPNMRPLPVAAEIVPIRHSVQISCFSLVVWMASAARRASANESLWGTMYSRGGRYELPEDFYVPTCRVCGAMFFDDELRNAARKKLKPAYMADQKAHLTFLIGRICEAAHVSIREIEKACGVTPTYLSHLLNGRKEASEPLIGLLEGFAIHPAEMCRRLGRKSMHDTMSVVQAISTLPCADVADVAPGTLEHKDAKF